MSCGVFAQETDSGINLGFERAGQENTKHETLRQRGFAIQTHEERCINRIEPGLPHWPAISTMSRSLPKRKP